MKDTPKHPIHLEQRGSEGARKFSPTAARNCGPISEVLSPLIPAGGRVVEIASGTGEHALHMCQLRTDIIWQPSDPDETSRASQDSWAQDAAGHMLKSADIDTTQTRWEAQFEAAAPAPSVIYCANMIHIAPWEAALGLAEGAGRLLGSAGICVLYGPFKEGDATAPSNIAFDNSLKSRNSAWGVRDLDAVKHIFALQGFNLSQRTGMPKNNQILVFTRS